VVALVLWTVWPGREAERGIRIVVLPFTNLGEPEDLSFATGLTQEITANLTLIPRMLVIPGRDALGEKGVTRPPLEIGEELQVDYVLMGAVDWGAGPRQMRVRPQLIRLKDKVLVFGKPLEVGKGDLFKAQQEISRAVISKLDITLTPEQTQAIGERSTKNPEAYRAYVDGLMLKDQPFYSPKYLEQAARMFEQAVDLDPDFAEAWAELSQVHSYLGYNTDRSSKRKEQARGAMNKAVAEGPNLLATHLARAYFSYRCEEDYGAALRHIDAAARLAPNLPEVLEMRGLLLRRQGRLAEAIELLRRASELKPRKVDLVWPIAETYGALREYDQADKYFERAISLAPDQSFYYEQQALNRLAWTGNLAEARAILEDSPVSKTPQLQLAAFYFDLYERKYRQALARVSPEDREELSFADQCRLAAMSVVALERLGDRNGARALAEANLSVLRLRTAQYSRHPLFRIYLALALAQLGRREEALANAEQAVEQSRHDKFSGPKVVEVQAMVAAILGRREQAVVLLRQLLSAHYREPISIAKVRLDPVWSLLHDNPCLLKQLTH
jgi:tetratricopeptide (TPR) repeat protein